MVSATKKPTKKIAPKATPEKGIVSRTILHNEILWWETLFLCRLAATAPDSEREDSIRTLFRMSRYVKALALKGQADKSLRTKDSLLENRIKQILSKRPPGGVMADNLRSISEALGLDAAGEAVLRHAILLGSGNFVRNNLDGLCDGCIGFTAVMDRFAEAWGMESSAWQDTLAPDAPLVRCGIVSLDIETLTSDGMLQMDQQLARALRSRPGALDKFLQGFLDQAPRQDLAPEDFKHLEEYRGPLVAALQSAHANHCPPHILLSGPPGTGKTQFALFLAEQAGIRPLLAKSEDAAGTALAGQSRRTALGISRHSIGSRAGNILIVDEAENILEQDAWAQLVGRESAPSPAKAWTNRFLEAPGTPMIWIVNSPEVLDPSILRRFTWHVPFRTPNRATRRRILDRHLGTLGLSETLLDELAARDDLPPHEASRLARVAAHVPPGATPESVIRLALASTDRLLGRRPPLRVAHATTFDPSLLNTDIQVGPMLDALRRRGSGRLGFFGPPGTGKSMLATEIARLTARPLHQKDASDLLSKYVGQTEEQIAEAFEQAADEGAVLFLDEIDGLLSDRQKARHSWERTQVNELLVRLERFPGIAILATNAPESLDPAVMRRLDIKLEFGPLSHNQSWTLFLRHAPAATIRIRERLRSLQLRLGDFGAALRGLQVQGRRTDSESLLEALESEVEFREAKRGEV